MSEPLFLGIDGGGTKCAARLRDARGALLGEGAGGPSNVRLGPDVVWNSVLTATRQALSAAQLGDTQIGRVHVGMGAAGAGQASALDAFLARPNDFAAITVDTDAHSAWLGAFGGADGAILIVGTGSCGYACVQGQRHYVGGWGFEISDEGSGAVIGRDLLRHAIWTHDGRITRTPLADEVLTQFQDSPEHLVDWVGSAKPGDHARFAPLVLHHARRQDPLAIKLIETAAGQLGEIALRLLALGAPSICLFGGLAEPLRPWLPSQVQAAIVAPQADALDGAILLARDAYDRAHHA